MIAFKREKLELEGKTKVLYSLVEEAGDATPNLDIFKLEASRAGVSFSGTGLVLRNTQELQEFAKVLSEAWTDSKKLTPKIFYTEAGHY